MNDALYSSDMLRNLPQAHSIQELLVTLRKQPGLIGHKLTLSTLSAFIEGFLYCRQGINHPEDWKHMSLFSKRPVKTLIDGEFIVVSSPPSLIGENPYHGSTHASRPAQRATLATAPSGLENLRPVPFAVLSQSPTLGPYL